MKGRQMVNSYKSPAPLLIQQIVVLSFITLITWFAAFSGWKQALKIVNDTGVWLFPLAIKIDLTFFDRPVNIPCFLSTFLVLPLPYCISKWSQEAWHSYSASSQRAFLNHLAIYTLVFALLAPLFALGFGMFIGLAGGGLDILLSKETNLFWAAVAYGAPIAIPLILVTLVIFRILQRQKYAYWLLLPAFLAMGMALFRLMFLLVFLFVGVPPA